MIRFKKIKLTSDDKIQLDYEKTNQNGDWDEHSMKSNQEAHPGFYHALDNLAPHVEEVCELPKGDHQVHPYTIKGVSFSYSGMEEIMGATITATRSLNNSNSPIVLNTPHKFEESQSGLDPEDDPQVMSNELVIDIKILCDKAEEYLNGKRAQADLFEEEKEEEPEMALA